MVRILQAVEALGLFNVALDHMRCDVVRGIWERGGGEAYLREAGLRRRLRGRGLPIVHGDHGGSQRRRRAICGGH